MTNTGFEGDHRLNKLLEEIHRTTEQVFLENRWNPGLIENIRIRTRVRLAPILGLDTTVPGEEFRTAVRQAVLESYQEQTEEEWKKILLWESGKKSYPGWIDGFHDEYRGVVRSKLRASGAKEQDLEDLCQEVWRRIHDNIQKVRGPELRSYEGWMGKIAFNLAKDDYRRKEHSTLDQASHACDDPESNKSVEETLEQLYAEGRSAICHPEATMNFLLDLRAHYDHWSPQRQMIFDLHVAGYTQVEIAGEVGLSQSSVHEHLKKIFSEAEQLRNH